ncbi:MAG: GNAT family N-acetyltransferase [Candidatus Odinarchaeota archaeon]
MKTKPIIRDLVPEDAGKIIKLIKKVYGESYFEREYYDIEFIQRKLREKHAYWKGAFINGTMIGQMLFTLSHNAGYLKVTMADPEFRALGIITQISIEMIKMKEIMNSLVLKCVYAIIDKNNLPIIKILNNFNFKYLGKIPNHDHYKGLIIYGLILYDFNWKMIKPHLKLSSSIYHSIQTAELKRVISTTIFKKNSRIINNFDIEITNSKIKFDRVKKFQICLKNGKAIAEITENHYQKCWYDFKFLIDDLSLLNKRKVIELILFEYSNNNKINSISFPIPVHDTVSQNILINLGAKYYAYLPFYYREYDSILLGFSKIEKMV